MVGARPLALVTVMLLSLGALLDTAVAATAKVDRSRIGIDDTFSLSIEIPSGAPNDSPELAPLEKDFDLLGTTQSSQIQIINGRTSSSTQWIIKLAPKREGKLTIPALKVGKDATQALVVQVSKNSPQSAAKKDVLLEAEVDAGNPYVQQQVILTVRLLHRVPLREGALAKPQIRDAVVERLGEDTAYDTKRGADTYHVVERRYAVFPQKSALIEIDGLHFDGKVPDPRTQNRGGSFGRGFFDDPFDLMQPTTTVRVRAAPIILDVKPVPAGAEASPWLPARKLTVEETWSEKPPKFTVGQPITRTVTLRARGLTAAQLPPLDAPQMNFANLYPDHSGKQARAEADGVVSESEQKLAIIPTRAGEFELPEIRIPWWNVQSNRQEYATIPSRKITVAPAAAGSESTAVPEPELSHETQGMEMEAVDFTTREQSSGAAPFWRWVALAALCAWIATIALWLVERGRRSGRSPATAQPGAARKQGGASREVLKKACAANDPVAARAAVLAWAQSQWPEKAFNNLGDVSAAAADSSATQALAHLDRVLYGGPTPAWDGNDFLGKIEPLFAKKRGKGNMESALPPLYPSETTTA